MGSVRIDRELCTQCGLCVQDCVRRLFFQQPDGQIGVQDEVWCILCGHCVAVCPTGAISHSALGSEGFDDIPGESRLALDSLRAFLRMRRSVRAYRDQPVPRSVLEELVEVARFVPTASNQQNVAFTIVDDRATIKRLADLTADFYHRLLQGLREPSVVEAMRATVSAEELKSTLNSVPRLERLVSAYRRGEDVLLWNAPVLLVAHAPKADYFGRDNCLFAVYALMLAATARGVGTCLMGFVLRAVQQDGTIAEVIGLPADQMAHAVLAAGYPRYQYSRLVPRKPIPIRWLDNVRD